MPFMNKKLPVNQMIRDTHFFTTKDGVYLFGRTWRPDITSDSTIIILHCIGEHSGSYGEWAKNFVASGYNVLAMDSRGYGKSGGRRGGGRSYRQYLNDLDFILKKAGELFNHPAIYLYGHGMGGNLAINYLIQKKKNVKGLILSAPWLRTKKTHKNNRPLLNNLSKVLPSALPVNGIKPAHLTHNRQEVLKCTTDPLNYYKISLKLYDSFSEAGLFALNNKHKINLPVLIIHGKKDPVTSYRASQELSRNASSISIRVFENCFHALHLENENHHIFSFVLSWLKNNAATDPLTKK